MNLHNNSYIDIKYLNTTTHEINKIIKSWKSMNPHSYDEIPVKIIPKASTNFITSPITYICNQSLSTSVFLTRLKYSKIKHIYLYIYTYI
jgi:hypothetical protein